MIWSVITKLCPCFRKWYRRKVVIMLCVCCAVLTVLMIVVACLPFFANKMDDAWARETLAGKHSTGWPLLLSWVGLVATILASIALLAIIYWTDSIVEAIGWEWLATFLRNRLIFICAVGQAAGIVLLLVCSYGARALGDEMSWGFWLSLVPLVVSLYNVVLALILPFVPEEPDYSETESDSDLEVGPDGSTRSRSSSKTGWFGNIFGGRRTTSWSDSGGRSNTAYGAVPIVSPVRSAPRQRKQPPGHHRGPSPPQDYPQLRKQQNVASAPATAEGGEEEAADGGFFAWLFDGAEESTAASPAGGPPESGGAATAVGDGGMSEADRAEQFGRATLRFVSGRESDAEEEPAQLPTPPAAVAAVPGAAAAMPPSWGKVYAGSPPSSQKKQQNIVAMQGSPPAKPPKKETGVSFLFRDSEVSEVEYGLTDHGRAPDYKMNPAPASAAGKSIAVSRDSYVSWSAQSSAAPTSGVEFSADHETLSPVVEEGNNSDEAGDGVAGDSNAAARASAASAMSQFTVVSSSDEE